MLQSSTSPEPDAAVTVPRAFQPVGDLLTTTQAAARCGITERTLATYWRAGTGPVRTRIGGQIRVAEQALADWLAARTEPQPIPHPMPPDAPAAAA